MTDDANTRIDWNGPTADAWVETQELLDDIFRPFEQLLVEAAGALPGDCVLDVGCGAGSLTLAFARATGQAVGVDISEAMIAAARSRAEREGAPASFVCADAESHPFERATFDRIVSRFGVMFFDDPVAAFTNLRRAAADHAALHFAAWRGADENPFMTTAERAAAPLLTLPARRPHEPGQFALADRERVQRILEQSGWSAIEIQPIDVVCTLPKTELVRYATRLGPVGRAWNGLDDRTRAQVIESMTAAFAPYVRGAEVRFTAACWMVSARTERTLEPQGDF